MSRRETIHQMEDDAMEYNRMKCKYCREYHGTITDHTMGFRERSVFLCKCQRKYFMHMIKNDYENGCFKRIKTFDQLMEKINEMYS